MSRYYHAKLTEASALAEIDALGGPTKAARTLTLYLRIPKEPPHYRRAATLMLSFCGDQVAPVLRRLTGDNEIGVRIEAANGLGIIQDELAIPFLKKMLSAEQILERTAAERALRKIAERSGPGPS